MLFPAASHLILEKGGKTIGVAFTGTKSLLWVLQNLGVQSLGRGISISIIDGEVGWQREIILHQKSFGAFFLLIAPVLGQSQYHPQGRSLPVSDCLILQVWRSIGIWKAGSPTRDPRVWPEPHTCSAILIQLPSSQTGRSD